MKPLPGLVPSAPDADLGAVELDLVALDADVPRRVRLPLEVAAGVLALVAEVERIPGRRVGLRERRGQRRTMPAPWNGVSAPYAMLCGSQLVYARYLKTSYRPPRSDMYVSSRPKFSP